MQLNEKKVNIYSRPRICISKFENKPSNRNNKFKKSSNKEIYKVMIVILIAIITTVFIVSKINPPIDKIAINEVQNRFTKITNNEAQNIMQEYKYDDLVNIITDNDKNIVMIQANANNINKIASTISINIVDKLKESSNSNIRIYFGSLVGITLLSGTGPRITARISSTGNVNTNLKSEFSTSGINQTLHKIYLEVNMNVSILTPYHSISSNTKNEILLAESIIVGNVPETYYYLNSLDSIDPSNFIQ